MALAANQNVLNRLETIPKWNCVDGFIVKKKHIIFNQHFFAASCVSFRFYSCAIPMCIGHKHRHTRTCTHTHECSLFQSTYCKQRINFKKVNWSCILFEQNVSIRLCLLMSMCVLSLTLSTYKAWAAGRANYIDGTQKQFLKLLEKIFLCISRRCRWR